MATIKPIETEYKGYKFRSRLEARWAVFFDACGVEWEYEPEVFDLGDGLYYLPDFRLSQRVTRADGSKENLWVEVKGEMSLSDYQKLIKFINDDHPLIFVGTIPDEADFQEACNRYSEHLLYYNSSGLLQNIQILHVPCVLKNGAFGVTMSWYSENQIDFEKTIAAYAKARQASFDKKPRGELIQLCECTYEGYSCRSKDSANGSYIYGVSVLLDGNEYVSLESRSGDSWGLAKLKYLEKFIGYDADGAEIWIKVFD